MSQTNYINDEDILASLSSFTKSIDEMSSAKFDEMRRCSFFDPIPADSLMEIAKDADLVKFTADKHITNEGEPMNAFHVLLYGTATAYSHNIEVGSIRAGECIGEGTFFSHESLTRSATVIADCEVLALELRKSVVDKMEGETRIHMDKALLLALFKKLQAANRKIESLIEAKADLV
jgi:signal-transduction protein with cAMP-binding, CBS, and nucleotidyltransferase domain